MTTPQLPDWLRALEEKRTETFLPGEYELIARTSGPGARLKWHALVAGQYWVYRYCEKPVRVEENSLVPTLIFVIGTISPRRSYPREVVATEILGHSQCVCDWTLFRTFARI